MSIGSPFLTSNTYIAFPFREDVGGLVRTGNGTHGGSATLPINAIADAALVLPYDQSAAYLTALNVVSGTVYRVVIGDSLGASIVTGTFDTSLFDSARTFEVIRLVATPNAGTAVFTVDRAALLTYLSGTTVDTFGTTLQFEASVAAPRNRKVESFEIYTTLPSTPTPTAVGPISGKVRFTSGYNFSQFLDTDPDVPDTSLIDMSVVPGQGAGQWPCEGIGSSPDTPGLPQIRPDQQGNVQIATGEENCYSIIPTAELQTFAVHSVCNACCACEDYAAVSQAILGLQARSYDPDQAVQYYQPAIFDELTEARDCYYEPAVTQYNAAIATALDDPAGGDFLSPSPAADGLPCAVDASVVGAASAGTLLPGMTKNSVRVFLVGVGGPPFYFPSEWAGLVRMGSPHRGRVTTNIINYSNYLIRLRELTFDVSWGSAAASGGCPGAGSYWVSSNRAEVEEDGSLTTYGRTRKRSGYVGGTDRPFPFSIVLDDTLFGGGGITGVIGKKGSAMTFVMLVKNDHPTDCTWTMTATVTFQWQAPDPANPGTTINIGPEQSATTTTVWT